MSNLLSALNNRRAFTLIESMVVLAIFTFAMMAISASVIYFYRTNANAIEQAFALSSARRGVEFMVRDLREMTYSEEGNFPISTMSSTTITFYSDTDRDKEVERIRYFFSDATTLSRGTIHPTGSPLSYNPADEVVSIVSEEVRNAEDGIAIFVYYDEEGNVISNYANVTDTVLVDVTMIVNVNPTRLPEEFTLRSTASLRNL